ncbi:hypothetical protein [Pseudonocardia sp.]|uniref:hypothetical protein n=1 Tax=Pseudonocardia sp. TaxID=60912 RepID=UPI003D14A419
MSKIALVLRELHRSQASLAHELHALTDRHVGDHEIVHTARDLAGWARDDLRRLEDTARACDVRILAWPRPGLGGGLTRRVAGSLVHRPEPGLLLLADLRRLYRKAAGVDLDWTLLAQSAQAMRQRRLLDLATTCAPHSRRTMTWAQAQLKVVSPQIIAS